MTDHERIFLEPEDGSDPDTGRMWCQHPAPGAGDDRTWTEYVRADLVAAMLAAARAEGVREGMEKAAGIAGANAWRCPNAGCTSIAAAIRAAMEPPA